MGGKSARAESPKGGEKMKQKTKSRSHQLNPWFQLYLKLDLLMHFSAMQTKKSLFYLNGLGLYSLQKKVNVPMKGTELVKNW